MVVEGQGYTHQDKGAVTALEVVATPNITGKPGYVFDLQGSGDRNAEVARWLIPGDNSVVYSRTSDGKIFVEPEQDFLLLTA